MKKHLPLIIIGMVLLVGIGVLLYPTISDKITQMTADASISDYQKTVGKLDEAEIAKLKEAARNYNKTLVGSVLTDPFLNEAAQAAGEYVELLNINDVMGYIEIPKIDIYLPLFHGTSDKVLQKGVGHLDNTSIPIGGLGTHAVLSGHRGLPSAMLFTNLDQMAEGDLFYLHILNEILAYEVDQIKVVEPTDIGDLLIESDKDYVTLLTCTPYGINSQRLLIRGVRTEYQRDTMDEAKGDTAMSWLWIIAAVAIAVLFMSVIVIRRRRRQR